MNQPVVEFLKTTGQALTWTVPEGVYRIRADAIGAGANGNPGTSSGTSKGGSGGAYAFVELDVTPGQQIEYFVSPPTAFSAPRSFTYLGLPVVLAVESGVNTNGTAINEGGTVWLGSGFQGGRATVGRRGGGGAAGPNGIGGQAGNSGGGGANGGGSSTALPGGTNRLGYGGGAAAVDGVSPAGAGVDGGGGGGGIGTIQLYALGGNGSQNTIWTSTITGETAGPGGGGGASSGSFSGGNAGGYGGGGGGSRSGAVNRLQGTQGIIVLTYTIEPSGFLYSYWL